MERPKKDPKTQKSNTLLATLALTLLCLLKTVALAQTTHFARPVNNEPTHYRRAVVVRIKNGPVIRGRLLEADKDSIWLEVEDISCPITFDAGDVASIDLQPAEVAKEALPKAPQASSPQALAEVRAAPIALRNKSYRSRVGPRVTQGERTARPERVRRRAAGSAPLHERGRTAVYRRVIS